MNNRERIVNTILCREVDRQPFFFAFGPWAETIVRWEKEGLDKGMSWDAGIGFDEGFSCLPINLGYSPCFESFIVEERANTRIVVDKFGIMQEIRKEGSSIPRFIDYPVKDRDDWERLKAERLNPLSPDRFPDNWNEIVRDCNKGSHAIQLGWYPYGLFGTLRDMMGVERLLVSFYDEPDLIRDMMDSLTDFWLVIYEKVCRDVKVDCIHMWEDMSGKNGSLISPKMVREFMLPNYRRIRAFADRHAIPAFSLDTDGNCSELVPIFMEAGINLVFPFEVAAGCDINSYRQKYPNLCIMGGIDKQEIAKGKEAIDGELARISSLFAGNGYIASLDHLIPPDISRGDFLYFCKRVKEYIGVN
jgi:uroporphyrinogen decarboxylase